MQTMLQIELRRSWIFAGILATAYGAAMVIFLLLELPRALQLVAIALLFISLALNVRRYAWLRAPDSIVALEIASDDAFSLRLQGGDWLPCVALGSTYVTGFVVVANLKDAEQGRGYHAVILPDGIDAEDFRRLRIWLRWKREAVAGDDQSSSI